MGAAVPGDCGHLAAEDDPDDIQIEEPDLDVPLSRAEHVNINASRFGR